MTKITLTDLVNLQNETTAVNAINANNAILETAFDNTLSRDGTSPNTMSAAIDMNTNQIYNLPAPSTVNSPARLIDVTSNPTIVVPGTGTSGHVVPFLDGNNTFSGNNIYNGASTFSGATTFASPISNSNLANMVTGTFKGNVSGSTAAPSDLPLSSNLVTSIASNKGAFTLSTGLTNSSNDLRLALNEATLQTTLSSPTGTNSTTRLMMGLGGVCKLTPVYSTRLLINFYGVASNSVTPTNTFVMARYGTGAAPANAAAETGTAVANLLTCSIAVAGATFPFCTGGMILTVTPGVQYWFDISIGSSSGASTASISNLTFSGMEF